MLKLKLAKKQTTDQCNVTRCTRPPVGQFDGIGYLCTLHADLFKESRGKLVVEGPVLNATNPGKYKIVDIADSQELIYVAKAGKEQDLAGLHKELLADIEDITAYKLVGQDDLDFASAEITYLKMEHKKYKKMHDVATKSAKEQIAAAKSLFKPLLDTLEQAEKLWKEKLKEFKIETSKEQARLVAEAQQEADGDVAIEVLTKAANIKTEVAGVSFRDRWVWEVENLDEVPKKFLTVDKKKIDEVVKVLKAETKIPGVLVWNDPVVVSQ